MKAGWKTVKLGEACSFVSRGVSPKYVEDEGILVLNQKCIRNHRVSFDLARRHDSLSKPFNEERLVRAGDVLVNSTGTGTLGRVAQVAEDPPEQATVDSHVSIVRPKKELFHFAYFGYAMILIEPLITEAGKGSGGQTELSREDLRNNFEIPIPPLAEQKRIVALLDEAFADIDAAKAKAEDLELKSKELRASVLSQLLDPEEANAKAGWRDSSLGEVCDILDYKRRPVTKADRRTGPYPYYGATGVQDYVDQFIYDEPLVLLGEDGAKWKSGDRSAFLVSGKTWVNNHAHVLRPNREIIADEWLVYWLNHSDLTDFITGVTVPKLNQGNMVKIPVPLPPLTEQKRIVALLDEVFEGTAELCSHATNKMSKLSELKASLLTQAFCGELTA